METIENYHWSDWGYGPLEIIDGLRKEDIAEIVHWHEGENDCENWYGVLRMTDGRWAFFESGCDYTGWDCQAGGEIWYASSEAELVATEVPEGAKQEFGYVPTPDVGV